MSRSGYIDDCENVWLWRQAVARATNGARGQSLLRRLRDALDAMPTKRLIKNEVQSETGDVCALGALDPKAPFEEYEPEIIAGHFGIAYSLAAEIMYMNDEWPHARETPEERWTRMRAWVDEQIQSAPNA